MLLANGLCTTEASGAGGAGRGQASSILRRGGLCNGTDVLAGGISGPRDCKQNAGFQNLQPNPQERPACSCQTEGAWSSISRELHME